MLMADWLQENLANLAIAAVLCAVLLLAVRSIIKDRKAGKSSCGCSCEGCALKGKCYGKP